MSNDPLGLAPFSIALIVWATVYLWLANRRMEGKPPILEVLKRWRAAWRSFWGRA